MSSLKPQLSNQPKQYTLTFLNFTNYICLLSSLCYTDLWNLANQTSLDLQTSERIQKSKKIKNIPFEKIQSRSESVPLSQRTFTSSSYGATPSRPSLATPKPALSSAVRHEMWQKRSMLTNPSRHVLNRRQFISNRPQSAAAAGNRRSASAVVRNRTRPRSRLESRCE